MSVKRTPAEPSQALVDEIMDCYVTWRERSVAVEAAFESWRKAGRDERDLAFEDYLESLDREERAAAEFKRVVEGARLSMPESPPPAA
jgi:hypothetical protein